MFFSLFNRSKKKQAQEKGLSLFSLALQRAKGEFPDLFTNDTPATDDPLRHQRFEAVSLTMSTLLWRLKHEKAEAVAQAAHDAMFQSFDRSLREGGVGDIGVSHKIKKYAQAFYGRLDRYTRALDEQNPEKIAAGLEKNMGLEASEAISHAKSMMRWATDLQNKTFNDLTKE